jgi:hypothetical protein
MGRSRLVARKVCAGAAVFAALATGVVGSPHAFAAVPVPTESVQILGGATFRAWAPAIIDRIDPWTTKILPRIDAGYYSCPTGCVTTIVDFPRTAGPLYGPHAPDVDGTIAIGSDRLLQTLRTVRQPSVIAALSLGSVAADDAQRVLDADPGRPPADALTFIVAGDPSRVTPLSNAIGSYLPVGFRVPVLGWTVTRTPTDSIYDTVVLAGEYDLVADFPDRPWNLLADINGVFGFFYGHGAASLSSPSDVPPQNIAVTTNSKGATTTTYLVPSPVLPMLKPLNGIVPTKVLGAVTKVLKPIVDRGYSRNDAATGSRQPYLQPTAGLPKLVKPGDAPAAASRDALRAGARGTAPASAQSLPRTRSAK